MPHENRKVGRQMGRKPVDAVAVAQRCLNPQEAIWAAIRTRGADGTTFTRRDLAAQLMHEQLAGINDDTIGAYLLRLERGGFVEVVDRTQLKGMNGAAKLSVYRLIKDHGREAPRLRPNGEASTQGIVNEQLWRSMKVLGEFDYADLMLSCTAEATAQPATVRRYLGHLKAAGYLAEVRPSTPGTPARYRLLPSMNTGPRPPMVQRTHRVFDPNLKRVVWSEEHE